MLPIPLQHSSKLPRPSHPYLAIPTPSFLVDLSLSSGKNAEMRDLPSTNPFSLLCTSYWYSISSYTAPTSNKCIFLLTLWRFNLLPQDVFSHKMHYQDSPCGGSWQWTYLPTHTHTHTHTHAHIWTHITIPLVWKHWADYQTFWPIFNTLVLLPYTLYTV